MREERRSYFYKIHISSKDKKEELQRLDYIYSLYERDFINYEVKSVRAIGKSDYERIKSYTRARQIPIEEWMDDILERRNELEPFVPEKEEEKELKESKKNKEDKTTTKQTSNNNSDLLTEKDGQLKLNL